MAHSRRSFKFPISPLKAIVLMRNTVECPEAENDAERTVEELMKEIDRLDGYVSMSVLEAALYNCNMNHEDKKFWHPWGWTFDKFIDDLLPADQVFDKDYNRIEDRDGLTTKTRR
jgi:hypothetical protein